MERITRRINLYRPQMRQRGIRDVAWRRNEQNNEKKKKNTNRQRDARWDLSRKNAMRRTKTPPIKIEQKREKERGKERERSGME